MTRFIEMKTNAPSPHHGWSHRERYTERGAPQAISMQARLNISGLCITHSWAQDIAHVQDRCRARVHVLKQGRLHVFVVAERRG